MVRVLSKQLISSLYKSSRLLKPKFRKLHKSPCSDTVRYDQIRADTGRNGQIRGQIRADTPIQIRADTGRYGQIPADMGRYGQIRSDTGRYGQIRSGTVRYVQIRADMGRYGYLDNLV